MDKLNAEQLKIVLVGLQMYKKEIKKMMKKGDELKTAEEEIKHNFLEVESIINTLSSK